MVEDATNKLAPPTFVIVFARPINCRSRRHFFPSRVKRLFEFLRIQFQTNLITDQSVMVAYSLRQKKKRAGCVEKNRFDHLNANIQRTTCFRNASTRAGGYGYLVWHLFAVAARAVTLRRCYLRNLKSGASSWTSLLARRINWDAAG